MKAVVVGFGLLLVVLVTVWLELRGGDDASRR